MSHRDLDKALKKVIKDVKNKYREPSKAVEIAKEAIRRDKEEQEALRKMRAEKKKKKK